MDTGPCRVEPRKLRIDRGAMWEILRIGVPAGMQSAMYALSNTLIMSSVLRVNNTLCPGGSAVIDGNSAALSIGNLISTCNGALALSYVSFTSQHAGAKQYERLRRFIGCAYLCCVTFSAVAATSILLARRPLLSLYVSEEMAFETAELRMSITVGCYFLCACMESGAQILRGLGKSTTSALITFALTCVGRVVWIYTVFEHFGTLRSVFISYPISWGLAALGQFIALTIVYRKQSGMPLIPLRKKTA